MIVRLKLTSALAIGLFAMSGLSFASTISTKVDNKEEKKEGTDKADEVITNRMMRASTGSLSNWSISTAWSYSAGSIEKPLEAERPNLTAAGDNVATQSMSADVGVSYRINPLNRVTFGVGLNSVAPFNKTINTDSPAAQKEFDENQGRIDVNNPNVSYTRLFKALGVQGWVSATALKYTVGALTDRGYDYYGQVATSTMYEFGKSGFSVGMYGLVRQNFFDKDDESLKARQQLYQVALLPQAEYVINDRLNFRTIIRPWWYQNTRAQKSSEWTTYNFTQSAGIGISVTRNVFLYPNIQWEPENIRADRTNVGLSANINLF
jgi:hypothetical protein